MFHSKRVVSLPAIALLAGFSFTPRVSSQLKYTYFADQRERLGESVAIAGDVNGDGYQDVLISSPEYQGFLGRVQVISGKTGTVLTTHFGSAGGVSHGERVSAAGDVDADGFADYLISEFLGAFALISGRTGVTLFELGGSRSNFGAAMDALGDLNADGHDDFLVTADGALDDAGYRVYSGQDFTILHSRNTNSLEGFGAACTGLGDVDRDGVNDFAVSSPRASPGILRAGRISVFSGATGSLIHQIEGTTEDGRLGWALESAGDVDGDGLDDLLASAVPFNNGPGQVSVYRSSDWTPIWSVSGDQDGERFGFSLAAVGDVNEDGRPDYLIGSPVYEKNSLRDVGRCQLYSYSETEPWKTWEGTREWSRLGDSLAGGGDVNGDGFLDVVIGSPYYDVFGTTEPYGLAEVHFLCPAIAKVEGQGWPGANEVPSISLDQAPIYESTCTLAIGNSSNFDTTGYLVVGNDPASLPTRFGGLLQLVPQATIPISLPTQGAVIEFQAPPDLGECEPALYLQALVVDPETSHGLAFSRRLKVKFGRD